MAASDPFLSPAWHLVAKLCPQVQLHAEITRHRARGQTFYVVRNPATGRSHRFSPEVYLLVSLLDGRTTVDAAWRIAAERLGSAAPSQDAVIRLLSQLHDGDLLATDIAPDLQELMDRRSRFNRSRWMQAIGNPMSLRLRLWNPDRFLTRTLPALRWLCGPFGLVVWLAAVVPALVLAGEHWDELSDGVSDRLLAGENLLLIALVFPVLKLLHEMGHGYAVKAGGGEVNEMGVMFLVFMPVPYVEASSASSFPSKWRRAGVGAAGMLVETFVAALAMQVWLVVEPGAVRSAAFTTMLIAGVSTVIFNGNPLLRFDGYFILSDLLAIPNLAGRATKFWGWLVEHFAFGLRAEPPRATKGERWIFALFAPASLVYRLFVTAGIALLVAKQYLIVGILIALWSAATSIVWPLAKALWHVFAGPSLASVRFRAVSITGLSIASVAVLLLVVPAPLHSVAEGVVWLPEESMVRAGGDGFVGQLAVASGTPVESNRILIRSADPDLAAEMNVDRARVAAAEARFVSVAFTDQAQANLARRELIVERSALARAEERAGALSAVSRTSGLFVVPRPEDLVGRYHKRGEVLGYVLPAHMRTVRVVVRQDDVGLMHHHVAGAELRLATDLAHSWHAAMVREVPAGTDEFPSPALTLDGGGSQAADTRDAQHAKALNRLFQYDLELPPEAAEAAVGGHVWVRFDHGAEPLGLQWSRRVRQLLLARFDA